MGRSETIELSGKFIEFPELEEPSEDSVSAILPVNFGELLAQAAAVVDRSNYRRLLQGINLSNAGVTATDGKQLLHLPCILSLPKDVTIPFPSALLAAKTSEMGVLQVWDKFFQIEIGNFCWHGKLLEGQYPNWRGVIPSAESHDYSITLHEVEKSDRMASPPPEPRPVLRSARFSVLASGLLLEVSSVFSWGRQAVLWQETRSVSSLMRMSCDCINAKTATISGGPHKWIAVLNVILIVLSHGMTVISAAAEGVSSDTLRCPKMSCKMLLNPTALHSLKSR
jgi:hypothetical protein